MKLLSKLAVIAAIIGLGGCVSMPDPYDYSAFKAADPKSVIILPPVNNTPEVIAPYSVMSQLVTPIAESGFYVFPVAVTEQTFRANGLTVAQDVHSVDPAKLHDIFGADAALYVSISDYGTSYVVISSETRVTVTAQLVDLRSAQVLWTGSASASSAETQNNNNGLIGMLVQAAVNQIFETVTDRGFDIAAITANRLLHAQGYNGLLYGPRSPNYGQPVASQKK